MAPVPLPAGPRTQPLSIPQEPSGFTTNHGQYVPPRLTPTAPGEVGVALGGGGSLP